MLAWSIVALAVVWAFANGAQDAPNAVTTTIVTRVLPERLALTYAAIMNGAGAMFGLVSMVFLHFSLVRVVGVPEALLSEPRALGLALVCGLSTAIACLFVGWWRGVPLSGWVTTLAAFAGAFTGALGDIRQLGDIAVLFLLVLIGPLLGFALSFALTRAVSRSQAKRRLTTETVRWTQTLTAGLVAFGHGLSNIRLPLGIVVVALAALGGSGTRVSQLHGLESDGPLGHLLSAHAGMSTLPLWIALLLAGAMALGTFVGGREIVRTLGRRLTDLTVSQGLAAETSTAVLLYGASVWLGFPVSSSFTIVGSIVGSSLAVSRKSVAWNLLGRIALWWVLTPLACAGIAWGAVLLVLP
ncbi:inorganic phosphate transporter [Dermabacter vaginalis]|uniref:inorganic phosphate transporter n=1 Tax=Dermabacter vaginalis TaxID=1630135 RepID=UPI001EF3F941|nr:inorganic phosphate transporter [Dermabacter vaginalis]MCG7443739.1 inorganic phosphate transporter [Dermabacter vaginalis]